MKARLPVALFASAALFAGGPFHSLRADDKSGTASERPVTETTMTMVNLPGGAAVSPREDGAKPTPPPQPPPRTHEDQADGETAGSAPPPPATDRHDEGNPPPHTDSNTAHDQGQQDASDNGAQKQINQDKKDEEDAGMNEAEMLKEAEKMADTAVASAPKTDSAAGAAMVSGNSASVNTAPQTKARPGSMDAISESAQDLGPDPGDRTHHSMDSLF